MRRRDFITGLGSAATWPLVVRAQQRALPVIGYLGSRSADSDPSFLGAFRQGLGEVGYMEGRNVRIEYRWADGQYDRLPVLAADLVRRQVNVIGALGGIPAALAAKAATTTIPIVFQAGVDPIEAGLIGSLSRPGGNITGVANLNVELGPKRLELLHEIAPAATRIAVLVNPTNTNSERLSRDLLAAARTLGVAVEVARAATAAEIERIFAGNHRRAVWSSTPIHSSSTR
jgi:putative ABC transport system substrate-binding protein